MKKNETGMDFCNSCVHFGYCMIYWGADCKRQGGYRTPKMKPARNNVRVETEAIQVSLNGPDPLRIVSQKKSERTPKTNKNDMIKKISKIFEPIRTRVVNW